MADRPVPDDPSQQPDPAEGSGPTPTEPLPPARPAVTDGPTGLNAGPPRAGGPPPVGAGAVPAGPPPGSGAVPGHQSAAGRLWGEATGTTGSRIVLAAAAVLAVAVLLLGAGLVGSVVLHRIGGAGFALGADDDDRWWGDDHGRAGSPPFGSNGRGNGHGNGRADGQGRPGTGTDDRGSGRGRAGGPGAADGSLPGLGTVLHGRFTTTLTGRPAVMLFQVGEVTATTDGESLTVRSVDGYEATYTLDATTAGAAVATGDRVRVVAAEDGMTVVVVQVLDTDR